MTYINKKCTTPTKATNSRWSLPDMFRCCPALSVTSENRNISTCKYHCSSSNNLFCIVVENMRAFKSLKAINIFKKVFKLFLLSEKRSTTNLIKVDSISMNITYKLNTIFDTTSTLEQLSFFLFKNMLAKKKIISPIVSILCNKILVYRVQLIFWKYFLCR